MKKVLETQPELARAGCKEAVDTAAVALGEKDEEFAGWADADLREAVVAPVEIACLGAAPAPPPAPPPGPGPGPHGG